MKTLRVKSVPVNRVLWGIISLKYRRMSDVAKDLGIDKDSVNRHLRGHMPRINVQKKYEELFGIPITILFNEKDITQRLMLKQEGKLERLSNCIPIDKYRKFSRPKKFFIQRPVLYAILLAEQVTLSQLADVIKLSNNSIRNYVYDTVTPHKSNLEAIADFLNFPKGYLMFNRPMKYEFGSEIDGDYSKCGLDKDKLYEISKLAYKE